MIFTVLKTNIIKILYKYLIRPILFIQDPEKAHNKFVKVGIFFGRHRIIKFFTRQLFNYQHPALEQNILDIDFKNPVGLSAGFDKDANMINILPDIGFGFIQIGTVTNSPYKGNPHPRLYRLPRSKGLVVYYGLKNIGAKEIIKKFKRLKTSIIPISISIGKTNSSETSDTNAAIKDYCQCLKQFLANDIGDFYTINISCPNIFGGEAFTNQDNLSQLLEKIYALNINKRIFLKMPINFSWNDFEKLLRTAVKSKVDGVIIGNLNKNRKDNTIKDKIPSYIQGGISGKPTKRLSNELISKTYKAYGDRLIIVGVGGIFSAEDAYDKIKRGASLVQLITGMIYKGPQLIGEINKDFVKLLKKDGYKNIQEAVGAYHR